MDKNLIDFVNFLADEAASITMEYYGKEYEIKNKSGSGFDPVTSIDIEVEKRLIALIKDRFPKDQIISEELNNNHSLKGSYWIIDPIDGTKAYISNVPVWSTLIGYNDGKKATIGMMDQPYLNNRYFAFDNSAYKKDLHNIIDLRSNQSKGKLSECIISATDPGMFKNEEIDKFRLLDKETRFCRWGLDALGYCLLASGKIDIIFESSLKNYDIEPLIPIIEISGGIVTDWQGNKIGPNGQVIACSNKNIHEQVLKLINE